MMQIEKFGVFHQLAVRCAPCHDMILSQMSECIKAEHHRHPHKRSLRKEEKKKLITFFTTERDAQTHRRRFSRRFVFVKMIEDNLS